MLRRRLRKCSNIVVIERGVFKEGIGIVIYIYSVGLGVIFFIWKRESF